MKRDWDVIREVLIEVEGLDRHRALEFAYISDPNAPGPEKIKADHAVLLHEAGLLSGTFSHRLDDSRHIYVPQLTWAGHDLLATLRSKRVWERIKLTAREKGIELSADAVKALAKLALDWVLSSP